MEAAPAILFCVGANKAGTSWLYRYLADHPQCRLPGVKELHYFDAYTFGRLPVERRRIKALCADLTAKLEVASGNWAEKLRGRLAEARELLALLNGRGIDEAAYRAFLTRHADGARLVADITPSYALLPEAVLERMQAIAAKVRFLFILRDPVDRTWSNLRMNAASRVGRKGDVAGEAARLFDLWESGGEMPVWKRADYAGALGRLAAAINPANLMIAFYEKLFSDEGLERLCRFLGIAAHPGDFSVPVHEGVPVELDGARAARARALLAPQYDYVRRNVGELPARWQRNMVGM